MTHTPYPLAKYSNSVPSVITFPVRTFESLTDEAKKFKADGSIKSNVSSYKNCEYEPLFKTNGPVLQHTSCMPVHLNLGIGLQVLNMVEKEAIKLDNDIKEVKGKTTDDIDKLLLEISKLEEEQNSLKEEIANYSDAIQQFDKELKTLQEKNADALKKDGRKYIDTSSEAKLIQKQEKNLKAKLENRKKEKKEVEKKNSCYLKSLKDKEEEFMKKRGLFKKDCVMFSRD